MRSMLAATLCALLVVAPALADDGVQLHRVDTVQTGTPSAGTLRRAPLAAAYGDAALAPDEDIVPVPEVVPGPRPGTDITPVDPRGWKRRCCSPRRKRCEWNIALGAWLPGLDGTVGVGDNDFDVDTSWVDILENLDTVLEKTNFTITGQLGYRVDRWWFRLNVYAIELGDEIRLQPQTPGASLTMQLFYGQVDANYLMGTTYLDKCNPCCGGWIDWWLFAGARVYRVENEAHGSRRSHGRDGIDLGRRDPGRARHVEHLEAVGDQPRGRRRRRWVGLHLARRDAPDLPARPLVRPRARLRLARHRLRVRHRHGPLQVRRDPERAALHGELQVLARRGVRQPDRHGHHSRLPRTT